MALAVAAAGALMAATGVVGVHGLLTSSDGPTAPASDVASSGAPQESTTSLVPVTVTETRDVFDLVVVPTTPAPPAVAAVRVGEPEPEHIGDSEEDSDDERESAPTTSAPSSSTTSVTSSNPSMPPGCIDGELEDDGRWNCQSSEHDD